MPRQMNQDKKPNPMSKFLSDPNEQIRGDQSEDMVVHTKGVFTENYNA